MVAFLILKVHSKVLLSLTCYSLSLSKLLLGHRAVYVGVHVPFSKEGRRRHKHRGHKHHHRRRKDKDSDKEDGRESPSYGRKKLLFTNGLNFFSKKFHVSHFIPMK